MRAVLEDALTCFQRQCETERRWVQREAREAEEWFFSDDAHGLFSYASVCAVLGLEPETIRQKLMHRSQSHPNLSQRPQSKDEFCGHQSHGCIHAARSTRAAPGCDAVSLGAPDLVSQG